MKPNFLIIDDDDVTCLLVKSHLENLGYQVKCGKSAADLRSFLATDDFNAIFLDIYLPDGNGIELITEIQRISTDIPIIMITGDGRVETVVEAMQAGAFDYCPKPLELPRLKVVAKNALDRYTLERKVSTLEKTQRLKFDELIGGSAPMQVVYHIIETVAPTKAPVLITGESGCGKELVARAIHNLSPRRDRELVDVNCAAIPKDLLESELFGHEKSAFTGATKRAIGRCERAHQSSLFLDEIGEMNISLQAKMLRFLQEYAFYRVGSQEKIHVDVRIISATNRNPLDAISRAQLREDLYYRLNVVNIDIPPLRKRLDDISNLTEFFLERYSKEHNRHFESISQDVIDIFKSYSWPGNVRELENCIQQLVVLHDGLKVEANMLPAFIRSNEMEDFEIEPLQNTAVNFEPYEAIPDSEPLPKNRIVPLVELEKIAIDQALRLTRGNVGQSAVGLQMSQATLYRKVRDYGLDLKNYK